MKLLSYIMKMFNSLLIVLTIIALLCYLNQSQRTHGVEPALKSCLKPTSVSMKKTHNKRVRFNK
jgi:hypothetical protein